MLFVPEPEMMEKGRKSVAIIGMIGFSWSCSSKCCQGSVQGNWGACPCKTKQQHLEEVVSGTRPRYYCFTWHMDRKSLIAFSVFGNLLNLLCHGYCLPHLPSNLETFQPCALPLFARGAELWLKPTCSVGLGYRSLHVMSELKSRLFYCYCTWES